MRMNSRKQYIKTNPPAQSLTAALVMPIFLNISLNAIVAPAGAAACVAENWSTPLLEQGRPLFLLIDRH